MERYTIEILRSGQPRPYADTERECLIRCERQDEYGERKGQWRPWLYGGDVEKRIAEEDRMRAEGRMLGGESAVQIRKSQRDWCLKMVKALFQNFREKGDQDGKVEGTLEAYFYPTLKSLQIDQKAGTIRALIIEPYTD